MRRSEEPLVTYLQLHFAPVTDIEERFDDFSTVPKVRIEMSQDGCGRLTNFLQPGR